MATLLLLAAGTACQLTATVGVDLDSRGGGLVRVAVGLDDQALHEAGLDRLSLTDLRRARWDVVGPRRERDGRTWLRASKRFSGPEEADRVLAEVTGSTGPLGGLRLRRRHSLWRTTSVLAGQVDLRPGFAGLADPDLQRRVGADLGVTPDALRQRFGDDLDRVFHLELVARLPGAVRANGTRTSRGVVWRPRVGERLMVEATARAWNSRTIVLAGLALASAVAAVAVGAGVGSRRPRP